LRLWSGLCFEGRRWYDALRESGGGISFGTGSIFEGGTGADLISSWLALQFDRCTSSLNPRGLKMKNLSKLRNVFAISIAEKVMALNTYDLAANERSRLKESIGDDIRKFTDFLRPALSENAKKTAESKNIDLINLNWHTQSKVDPSRRIFHLEHFFPVRETRNKCLQSKGPEEVDQVLLNDVKICWILKSEDAKLTDLGYRSTRPDPYLAYEKAGIKIIE